MGGRVNARRIARERERGSAVSSEAENLVTVFRGGSKSFIQ